MGWKRVKEHYRIGHIVHVEDGNLAIGSPYILDIIVVAPDGRIVRGYDRNSGELLRYQKEIEADPAKFASLFSEPDAFDGAVSVWSVREGGLVESLCEEAGFPNVTHDGELMFDNTHFEDRLEAVDNALRSLEASVEMRSEMLEKAERDLLDARKNLALSEDRLADMRLVKEAVLSEAGTGA